MSRFRYLLVFIPWICIILCGVVKVSTEVLNTSKFIRDNSKLKVSFTENPFDFRIQSGDYILYVNGELLQKLVLINK